MPERLPTYLDEVRRISMARLHLARQEVGRALAALAGLEAQARAAGRGAQAMEVALLEALARQAEGAPEQALAPLGRSLAWAEAEGYMRLFVEGGAGVIPLLRRAAGQGIRPGYAARLLEAFGVEEEEEGSPRPPQVQPLAEPLTPRELEVLGLICDGLSNREIAERLTVTLNTVKKHSSHIYGKLGVGSRAQAMVRARELGLR
jgi:LuxR family maltose regulon positive regulatory protein